MSNMNSASTAVVITSHSSTQTLAPSSEDVGATLPSPSNENHSVASTDARPSRISQRLEDRTLQSPSFKSLRQWIQTSSPSIPDTKPSSPYTPPISTTYRAITSSISGSRPSISTHHPEENQDSIATPMDFSPRPTPGSPAVLPSSAITNCLSSSSTVKYPNAHARARFEPMIAAIHQQLPSQIDAAALSYLQAQMRQRGAVTNALLYQTAWQHLFRWHHDQEAQLQVLHEANEAFFWTSFTTPTKNHPEESKQLFTTNEKVEQSTNARESPTSVVSA